MKIKLITPNAKVPTRADEGAAGYDLYVPCDTVINPGRNIVKLDFQMELDPGTVATVRPRSGFSAKGIDGVHFSTSDRLLHKDHRGNDIPVRFDADVLIGTVDESYRGIVGVIIKSYERKPFILKAGTRAAQMVITQYCKGEFEVVESLIDSERGEGGFGHTGA